MPAGDSFSITTPISWMLMNEACAEVAAATGLSSRDLYQHALAARAK